MSSSSKPAEEVIQYSNCEILCLNANIREEYSEIKSSLQATKHLFYHLKVTEFRENKCRWGVYHDDVLEFCFGKKHAVS